MADKEYFGSGQFEQLLDQREYGDNFVSEVIRYGASTDVDFADMVREDVLHGNTATLRSFYKKSRDTQFGVILYDGTLIDDRLPVKLLQDTTNGIDANFKYYPFTPIRDDYSTAAGVSSYADLPDNDPNRIDTNTALKSLHMDWEEIVREIVEPSPISGGIDDPSFAEYRKQWEHSESLQEQYPTLQEYYDQIVQDQQEQQNHLQDISDIYIGLGVTGATLSYTNVLAIYNSYTKLLPGLTFRGYTQPSDGQYVDMPPLAYSIEYRSGTFTAVCGMNEWSHIIREGIVSNPENPDGWEKQKSTWNLYYGNSNSHRNHVDGDPIVQIVRANPVDNNWQTEGLSSTAFSGLLEIHVQLPPLADGTQVYGELRMWNYGTLHAVTPNDGSGHQTVLSAVISAAANNSDPGAILPDQDFTVQDGSTDIGTIDAPNYNNPYFELESDGDEAGFNIDSSSGHLTSIQPLDYATQNIYYLRVHIIDDEGLEDYIFVTVHVENTNSEPEPPPHDNPYEDLQETQRHGSDYVFFPIDQMIVRDIAIFKREHLLREATLLAIYSVHEEELQWYQKGWFKVAVFVAMVILSIIIPPLLAGAEIVINFTVVVTSAIQMALKIALSMALSKVFAGDSWIAQAIVLIVGLYLGGFNFNFSLGNISSYLSAYVIPAANLGMKMYFAQMQENLVKEMEDFRKQAADAMKKLEEIQEEAGLNIRSDIHDLTLFLATIPDPETATHMLLRSLSLETTLDTDVTNLVDVTTDFPDMLR